MSGALFAVAAILTPVAVIVGHILARQDRKHKADTADRKIDEVHILVNSRLSEALERIDELETKLGLTPGADVPASQILTGETPPVTTERNP